MMQRILTNIMGLIRVRAWWAMLAVLFMAVVSSGKAADETKPTGDSDQSSALARYESQKRISWTATGVSVSDALAKLEKDFGWSIETAGEAGEIEVDVDLKQATFFKAVESIRSVAKLTYLFERRGQRGKVVFPMKLGVANEKVAVCSQATGPFLVLLRSANVGDSETHELGTGKTTKHRWVYFNGTIIAEPGLKVSSVELEEGAWKNDAGEPLKEKVHVRMDSHMSIMDRHADARQFGWSAHARGDGAKHLAWTGQLKARVPLRVKSLRIEDLSTEAGKPKQIGNGEITFQKPRGGGRWEVTFSATGEAAELAGKSLNSGRMGVAAMAMAGMGGAGTKKPPKDKPGIYFLDGDGNEIGRMGHSYHGGEDSASGTLRLTAEPKSVLLRWYAENKEITYPIDLTNMPIPRAAAPVTVSSKE